MVYIYMPTGIYIENSITNRRHMELKYHQKEHTHIFNPFLLSRSYPPACVSRHLVRYSDDCLPYGLVLYTYDMIIF